MKATLLEPEIVTRKGKPVSVILPIADFAAFAWGLSVVGGFASWPVGVFDLVGWSLLRRPF